MPNLNLINHPQILQKLKYKHNTARWIKEQGKKAYQLGQNAMLNGLIQNAVEVLNVKNIIALFKLKDFSIQNDGDKPFTQSDAVKIHDSGKVSEIGQLGEETKLSIGWMANLKLCFISRNEDIVESYLLTPSIPLKIRPPHQLPLSITTEVFGTLEDFPNIKELNDFLIAIHNLNLERQKYTIQIGNNGDEPYTLTARLPLNPEISTEKLNGKDNRGKQIIDTLTIMLWKDADWSVVGKCPYSHPNGVYLLSKGVLITWFPCWGTEAHKKCFCLINDEEGRLFSTIVTRDKQVPNEKADAMIGTRKLWLKHKPRDDKVSNEEKEKVMTNAFRKMMTGEKDEKWHYKCNVCSHDWFSEEITNKCPNCGSLDIEEIKTDREQFYLYRCTNNKIPEEQWNKKLLQIPNDLKVGCIFEERLEHSNLKIHCKTCDSLMKRVIEQPDQTNRKFKIEIHGNKDYEGIPPIKIGDVVGGIVYVNDEDPLFPLYDLEFGTGKFKETFGTFLSLGTILKRKTLSTDELAKKNLDLIEEAKTWRLSKRSAIKRIKKDLINQDEIKDWFSDY